ncbi:MAG: polyprenol monophosphomannose synthase [Saprospiraceae bacterium]|nr:polyprenol monophosphomannose synthase [Saprospiraceae bacterium]
MSKVVVVIPTYNEIENIEAIIRSVFQQGDFHILIMDDNSPDGTADMVRTLQNEFPSQLQLLVGKEKSGLGRAYIRGFNWALKNKYEYIIEMDADFSHPPSSLSELFNCCLNDIADVSIGSRYVEGGGVVNWPLVRLLISRSASLYVRLITGMNIKDPTAGFVCYKSKVLETINLESIRFVGYAFQIEMKYKSFKNGFRLKEIPIIFPDRIRGKSKMNILIIKEALFGVFKMRFFTKN